MPWVAIIILLFIATAYTSYTSGLLYRYYDMAAPLTRFIPCICEATLIDTKYRKIIYILYGITLVMLGGVVMPYSVSSLLGEAFALNHVVWFGLIAGLMLLIIQIVKGIGLAGCMKDIADDWYKQTHSDVGLIKRFTIMGFIPFVRVIALYSLNKPLSTMVEFIGVGADDVGEEEQFFEEEE